MTLRTLAVLAATAALAVSGGIALALTGNGPLGPDHADSVDLPTDGAGGDYGDWADGFDADAARRDAASLLGADEAGLDPYVRVGRRGGETYALTEDYVLGRATVELDPGPDGRYTVVSVTVELPDGPETLTRDR
jgi:hypothetical protein